MGLIEEVTVVILEINQYEIILHTQGKSRQLVAPPLEEWSLLKALQKLED